MREDQRTCQIRGTEYETAVNIIADKLIWENQIVELLEEKNRMIGE